MMPCALLGDFHMCPMVTPGVPPIPHVGGPIMPPGVPTILVMGKPPAPVGNMATCVGPPDVLAKGSATVLIGGRPCVRIVMDTTGHGGMVVGPGAPTVMVGG